MDHKRYLPGAALVLCALIAADVPRPAQAATGAPPQEKTMHSEQVDQRGKRLRLELEQTYRDWRDTNSLQRGRDITALVAQFIPEGSSFDEAEAVLRAAGCQVGRRYLDHRTGELTRKDDVDGTFTLASHFPNTTRFIVVLTPPAPGDYTKVARIRASITVATL
jgi:hypothetical protein